MIIKKLVSPILSNLLSKYIENINLNELKLSLFSGNLSLDNLSIKANCLFEHQIPIKIIHGTIKRIRCSIPYVNLKTNPSIFEIENLFIFGKFSDNSAIFSHVQSYEFQNFNLGLEQQRISQKDFQNGLFESILENMKVKITNIHIRIEHEINKQKVSLGVIIPEIQISTTDENGNSIQQNTSKSKIYKQLLLTNLSIYIDTNNGRNEITPDQFNCAMMNSINDKNHQFILNHFSFNASYIHSNCKADFVNMLNITTPTIQLQLTQNQYNIIHQLLIDNRKYRSKAFYDSCERPNEYPTADGNSKIPLQWWNYTFRCFEKRQYPNSFHPNIALIFLQHRKEVLSQIQKSGQNDFSTELRKRYGRSVFSMLNYYINHQIANKSSDDNHIIDVKEIQEFVHNKKIQSYLDSWNINVTFEQIDTEFTSADHSYLIRIKQFQNIFKQNSDKSIEFNSLLQSVSISDDKQNMIFNFDNPENEALKIESTFKANCLKLFVQSLKSEIPIDIKWLKFLEKIKTESLLFLSKYKVDITFISPIFTFSYLSAQMSFNLGTVKLLSKDIRQFSIDCNNTEMKINQFHFITPTSFSIQLDCSNQLLKASIIIPTMKIHLHQRTFAELKKLPKITFSMIKLFNQINLQFDSLKISLFEEDRSVLLQYCFKKTAILFSYVDDHFYFQTQINSFKGIYDHKNLINFGTLDHPCIDFKIDSNKNNKNFDCLISDPTITIDFHCFKKMIDFFSYSTTSNDDLTQILNSQIDSTVELDLHRTSSSQKESLQTSRSHNDSSQISSSQEKISQQEIKTSDEDFDLLDQNNPFFQQLKTFHGKISCKNPKLVILFIQKDKKQVELKSTLDEFGISIQKNFNCTSAIVNLRTSIGDRLIFDSLSFNFNMNFLSKMCIKVALENVPLQIQVVDLSLLTNIFEYLYYYTIKHIRHFKKMSKFTFYLDITIQSISISILENSSQMLNFVLNQISIKTSDPFNIKVSVSNCIGYYDDTKDLFINFEHEASIDIDVHKTVKCTLSKSIKANIKMNKLDIFKQIFGHKEDVLEYETLAVKKFDFTFQTKLLSVKFYDKHQFAELNLHDASCRFKGAKTRIQMSQIHFSDPVQSTLYPPEVISSKTTENAALSLSIKPSSISFKLNNVTVFMHYHIIRRFIHLFSLPQTNFTIELKNTRWIVPVAFKKADEMLNLTIDGTLKKSQLFQVSINSLSAYFYELNGVQYDSIISNFAFDFAQNKSKISLEINPIDINFALNDVASFNVLVRSLGKFIKKEKLSLPLEKINEISIESKPITFILNSDRYKTISLFKFTIKQISLHNNKESILIFDHVLFNDLENQMWKIFLNAFSVNVKIISKKNQFGLHIGIADLLNINFSYCAVHLFLKYIPKLIEMLTITELCISKEPYFKIRNHSTEIVMIKNPKKAIHFEILPDVSQKFQIKREDEMEIAIGHHKVVFVPAKLHYPIFVNNQTVSQTLTESGTTITISPFLYFENHIECKLYLFKQKTVMTFANILEIPPGKRVPYTDLNNIRNASFALTSDKSSIISHHSLFAMRQIKYHPMLLDVDLPDRTKRKLIVVCKMSSILNNLVIKIHSNCIIRNQLPYHLFIKPAGYDNILHIKPGEKLHTTAIDAMETEFTGRFATSDSSHFKNDAILAEKVCVKTTNGSISPVPYNYSTKNKNQDVLYNVSFVIEAKASLSKPRIELICYPPTIVFNNSGFELECYSSLEHKQEKFGKFAPVDGKSDPTINGYFFWITEKYFDGNQHSLPLYLSTTEESERKLCFEHVSTEIGVISKPRKVGQRSQRYISSKFIDCMVPYIHGLILIPTADPLLFVPLHYSVEPTIPRSNSTRVFITNQLSICNQSNIVFYIQAIILPPEGDNIEAIEKKHKHKHLHKHKHKSHTAESSRTDEETSFSESTSSQFDSNYLQIGREYGEINAIPNNGENIPIRLVSNGLLFAFKINPQSVVYTTLNFSEPIHTTFALSGVLFELKIELINHETVVVIKKAIFPQPLNLLNDLEIGSPTIYITQKHLNRDDIKWINTVSPQTLSIVAYDEPYGGNDFFLHYHNEEIPIDLIEVNSKHSVRDIYYEVRTIHNTKTIIIYKNHDSDEQSNSFSLTFTIPTICVPIIGKLNREFALLTVQKVAFKYETGKTNLCEFKIFSMQFDDLTPASTFKVVGCCYPNVKDESELYDKNAFHLSISMYPQPKMLQDCNEITLSIAPVYLFFDISFVSDFLLLMESILFPSNSSSSLFSQRVIKNTNIYTFSAQSLNINQIQFVLMVCNQTPRAFLIDPLMTFFKHIPDLTNQQIILPCFHFEKCTMNTEYLRKEVFNPIFDSFMKQMYKLLYNTDIHNDQIGTKCVRFVKKREIYDECHLNTLMEVQGSMFLQGGETPSNLVSQFMRNRINTSNDTRTFIQISDTTKHQKKELQKTFTDSYLSNLLSKLIQMENDPIKGIYDASIQTFRKLITVDNPTLIPPIRVAHALAMFELPTYTIEMKALKDLSQFSFQVSDITEFYGEWTELLNVDPKTEEWIGVTQKFVFICNKDGTLKTTFRIKKISNIVFEQPSNILTLTLYDSGSKCFHINVIDQKQAIRIAEMINSRRIPLGIGE